MTESKANIVSMRRTFKVSDDVFEWVKTRQEEVRKRTGEQPTQSAVVLELIQSFEASIKNKSTTFPPETVVARPVDSVKHLPHKIGEADLTRVQRYCLEVLLEILRSDHPTAVPAIKSNLQAFRELVGIVGGEKIDDIRAFFANTIGKSEEDAIEHSGHGERTGNSKKHPPNRRKTA